MGFKGRVIAALITAIDLTAIDLTETINDYPMYQIYAIGILQPGRV